MTAWWLSTPHGGVVTGLHSAVHAWLDLGWCKDVISFMHEGDGWHCNRAGVRHNKCFDFEG